MLSDWNSLLLYGLRVALREISLAHAVGQICGSREFAAMTDEELWQSIAEARDSVISRRDVAELHWGTLLPDVHLMIAAVDQRCTEIAKLRNSATGGGSEQFNRRLALWHGVAAICLILEGETLLLLGRARQALDSFLLAEMRARSLPDEGKLHVGEILSACWGRRICGLILGNTELVRDSEAEIEDLIEHSGERREAESRLQAIQQQFPHVAAVLREREGRQSAGDMGSIGEWPEREYFDVVERLAAATENGGLSLDEALTRLRAEVNLDLVRPLCLYEATFLHRRLARTAVGMEIRSRMDYTAAQALNGPAAELARAYTALALGRALMERSRIPGGESTEHHHAYRIDHDAYAQALPFLHQAWETLSSQKNLRTQRAAAHTAANLVIVSRGLGRFDDAIPFGEQAIALLERWLRETGADPDLLIDLGAAHGNLGDIFEKIGRAGDGLRKHYEAFRFFADAKDLTRAQQALHILFDRCVVLGHYDEALAACQRLIPLQQELGDRRGIIRNYLDLARMAARTSPQRVGAILDEAQAQLDPLLVDRQQRAGALSSQFDLLQQRAHALIQQYRIQPSDELVRQAQSVLDQAGAVAEEIGHAEAIGIVYWHQAMLAEQTEDYETAERYCRMVAELAVSEVLRGFVADVLGSVQLKKGDFGEAAANLERSLQAYETDPLSLSLAQYRLGKALLSADRYTEAAAVLEAAANTFEKARCVLYEQTRIWARSVVEDTFQHLIYIYGVAGPLFNPLRAWEWLERAKARTFVELLADSPLPMTNVTGEVAEIYAQDQELQQRLRNLRLQVSLRPDDDPSRLDLITESEAVRAELIPIWSRLSTFAPDYVSLRTGETALWQDVQEMFAWEE
jgi:tetratricopeptide (TPR) repeat protein